MDYAFSHQTWSLSEKWHTAWPAAAADITQRKLLERFCCLLSSLSSAAVRRSVLSLSLTDVFGVSFVIVSPSGSVVRRPSCRVPLVPCCSEDSFADLGLARPSLPDSTLTEVGFFCGKSFDSQPAEFWW